MRDTGTTSSDSFIYAIPFCNELENIGDYYNSSGVYVFYGYSSDLKPKVLYVGESNDLCGRIVQHISGTSNLQNIELDGQNYEPFKYIRWIEIYTLDSDNANHRKMLEQALIAIKKPLHNNYTEDRTSLAERDYKNYLSREKSVINEIYVSWTIKTWEFNSLDWDYYREKYSLKTLYG
ncbi:hypothetical protein COO00_18840 [Bacillus toyonensis]|nr:hypothetical protein CON93_07135 [Bacillus toyonensis]PEA71048.1 hypothetical protein COO00_18840 [Bacillus toyonensis]